MHRKTIKIYIKNEQTAQIYYNVNRRRQSNKLIYYYMEIDKYNEKRKKENTN